jgi:hypothetical protein
MPSQAAIFGCTIRNGSAARDYGRLGMSAKSSLLISPCVSPRSTSERIAATAMLRIIEVNPL